jgi:hypothetical protein
MCAVLSRVSHHVWADWVLVLDPSLAAPKHAPFQIQQTVLPPLLSLIHRVISWGNASHVVAY